MNRIDKKEIKNYSTSSNLLENKWKCHSCIWDEFGLANLQNNAQLSKSIGYKQ